MTKEEIKWLKTCKWHPVRYQIQVDNDSVVVVDLEEDECVFTFDKYGWQMLVDLFRYMGCNADEV